MQILSTRSRRISAKLLSQSWGPALAAFAYGIWDFYSTAAGLRTYSGLVKSIGGTFFVLMWFTTQWLRTDKQLSDKETLESIQNDLTRISTLLEPEQVVPTGQIAGEIRFAGAPVEAAVQRVIDELSQSPSGALLILGAEIERALRRLFLTTGWSQPTDKASITNSVKHLREMGVLNEGIASSVRIFLDIRNRLLHGVKIAERDRETIWAIDVGLTVLRAVLAVPAQKHWVRYANIPVYSDADCLNLRQGVEAVLIEAESAGGIERQISAFPTTKLNWEIGSQVSWEFNMGRIFPNSWYRKPNTGEATVAWSSSAEFVGRNLEEV